MKTENKIATVRDYHTTGGVSTFSTRTSSKTTSNHHQNDIETSPGTTLDHHAIAAFR
jgi:hypothetical protein